MTSHDAPAYGPERRLTPELAARARAFEGSGEHPVRPRDAATIALVRDAAGPDGAAVEVYLLRRVTTMAFASGMHVFPGGTVDPRDVEHDVAWAGPGPAVWAERLGVDVPLAKALVCAAVRETFEESGVLLAGPSADEVVADMSDDAWEADRVALVERTLGFAELLERRGLVLRADLLGAWTRWMTPEFEPRRYDTAFFVAAVPGGQRTRDVGGEADRVAWLRPAEALAALAAGELQMLPPTAVVLGELAGCSSVDDVLHAAGERSITSIMPRPLEGSDPMVVVLPGEPGYDR